MGLLQLMEHLCRGVKSLDLVQHFCRGMMGLGPQALVALIDTLRILIVLVWVSYLLGWGLMWRWG